MDVSAFLALLLIALLSLLLFLSTGRKTLGGGDGRRLPPSPRGLPILGHLPLLGPLPHRKLWAMAQAHGPVMLLRFGSVPTVVASSAAAAQEVMKIRDLAFASRPRMRMAERLVYGRDMAFAPYGEYWRQARRVCVLHLLSQRRVSAFRDTREQEVAVMLARVRAAAAHDGAVNLTAHIISYTNGIISRAAFGDKGVSYYDGLDGGEKLTRLFADFEGLLGTVTFGDFVPWLAWVDALMGLDAKAARTSAEMSAFLERVIADHRQKRRGGHRDGDDHRDFVDVLLDVNEDEEEADRAKFDDVAIKAIIQVRSFASRNLHAHVCMFMISNPGHVCRRHGHDLHDAGMGHGGAHQPPTRDAQGPGRDPRRRRRRRPRHRGPPREAALPQVRHQGDDAAADACSAPLPRETTVDTELLGYHVPARTRVIVNAWAIARDPATWERADEFVPERFAGDDLTGDYLLGQDFRFVPFGAGRRGCPGVGFAVPPMELALASLLHHFDWELPAGGPSKLDMDEVNGLSVRLKANLCLVAKPWCRP